MSSASVTVRSLPAAPANLREFADAGPVSVQLGGEPLRECGVPTSLGQSGEVVEDLADPGQLADQGPGGCVLPGLRDRAEGRLADEARRRQPAGSGSLGDEGELVRTSRYT